MLKKGHRCTLFSGGLTGGRHHFTDRSTTTPVGAGLPANLHRFRNSVRRQAGSYRPGAFVVLRFNELGLSMPRARRDD